MSLTKAILIFVLLIIGCIETVKNQCSSPFISHDGTNFCYYLESISFTWSDGYNQCLDQTINGILIQLFSLEQFNDLKNLQMITTSPVWLGANNFASFRDWHWLDGSIVDSSVVTWCPNNTHETAIGAYCAAYEPTLDCVNNYLCSTLFPTPCVARSNVPTAKSLSSRAITNNTGVCTNSYSGAYANWWTYSILLLNWFILFCFILHIINRFNITQPTVILTVVFLILSFMMIIAFAILWGVQYQDIILLPLIVVIMGSIASILLLIDILILVSNRNVQRWLVHMIVTIMTIIIESVLMLGVILCTAHCSAYISLTYTSLDKDIIAALLASLAAAISILFYNGIIYSIGHAVQDRVHAVRSTSPNPDAPLQDNTAQTLIPRRYEQIERATSPVDQRILNEFYSDRPKDIHQYQLEGRQYVVYEGKNFTDIEPLRQDLTQAMLAQQAQGLRQAIARVKSSSHAAALADELRQAESLLKRLK